MVIDCMSAQESSRRATGLRERDVTNSCRPMRRSDIIAQAAQVIIFLSLLVSIITNVDPDNHAMATLLPALLMVPIVLTLVFTVGMSFRLRSLTLPDKDGNYSRAGHVTLVIHRACSAREMPRIRRGRRKQRRPAGAASEDAKRRCDGTRRCSEGRRSQPESAASSESGVLAVP